ncbi:hypothetical protein HYV10_03940 [Candidatus Dependentiae bacterium]|nr:hypothetical protein [Candidatus Dependentiae bacterium]
MGQIIFCSQNLELRKLFAFFKPGEHAVNNETRLFLQEAVDLWVAYRQELLGQNYVEDEHTIALRAKLSQLSRKKKPHVTINSTPEVVIISASTE